MGYTHYETPGEIFVELDKEFGFTMDVCAEGGNAKCERWYGEKENGLIRKWEGVCWCNPPFDRTKPMWVKKSWESAQEGCTVVLLVPWNGTGDTSWWHKYVLRSSEIRYLRGRQTYKGADGRKVTVRTVVVVFRPYCKGAPVALSVSEKGII